MRLRERADARPHCPYCREGHGDLGEPCAGCGVRLHADCLRELGGRCPTVGCRGDGRLPTVAVVHGPVGEATRLDPDQLLSPTAWAAYLLPRGLLAALGLALLLAAPGALKAIGAGVALLVLAGVALRALDHAHARRFRGGALAVQPCPGRPGEALQLTLTLPPALLALLREDPARVVRAELCQTLGRSSDGIPVPLWRRVVLARADSVQDGRLRFDVALPAAPLPPGAVWLLHLTCEPPGTGYQETWEVPVR